MAGIWRANTHIYVPLNLSTHSQDFVSLENPLRGSGTFEVVNVQFCFGCTTQHVRSSLTSDRICSPAGEVRRLNLWTTREVLNVRFLKFPVFKKRKKRQIGLKKNLWYILGVQSTWYISRIICYPSLEMTTETTLGTLWMWRSGPAVTPSSASPCRLQSPVL